MPGASGLPLRLAHGSTPRNRRQTGVRAIGNELVLFPERAVCASARPLCICHSMERTLSQHFCPTNTRASDHVLPHPTAAYRLWFFTSIADLPSRLDLSVFSRLPAVVCFWLLLEQAQISSTKTLQREADHMHLAAVLPSHLPWGIRVRPVEPGRWTVPMKALALAWCRRLRVPGPEGTTGAHFRARTT